MAMIREFGQDEITVTFAGNILNVRSFKYDSKIEKKQNHVLGQKAPYDYTASKETITGELVMPHSEFRRIIASLPAGATPNDIDGVILTVSYVQEGYAVNNVFEDCSVSGYSEMVKMDTGAEDVTLPLIIGKVVFGVS